MGSRLMGLARQQTFNQSTDGLPTLPVNWSSRPKVDGDAIVATATKQPSKCMHLNARERRLQIYF